MNVKVFESFVASMFCILVLSGMGDGFNPDEAAQPLMIAINSPSFDSFDKEDFAKLLNTGAKGEQILKLNKLGINEDSLGRVYLSLLNFINENKVQELQLEENNFNCAKILSLLDMLESLLKYAPLLMTISLRVNFRDSYGSVQSHTRSAAKAVSDRLQSADFGGQLGDVFKKAIEAAKSATNTTTKFIILDEPHAPIPFLFERSATLLEKVKIFTFKSVQGLITLAVGAVGAGGGALAVLCIQRALGDDCDCPTNTTEAALSTNATIF